MGIDVNGLNFLLRANGRGDVDFSHTLTIGRQTLYTDPSTTARLVRKAGLGESQGQALCTVEGLLTRQMGAQQVESLDASSYEGATIRHDLNEPLPPSIEKAFTVAIDGGTLEHVFDAPRALANILRSVRPGGHFIGIYPANNQMGHGFYQFSPEFFFRALEPRRGYEVVEILACERGPRTRWYQVEDPQHLGRRVQLRTSNSVEVFILAKRVSERVSLDQDVPQQSDYVAAWGLPRRVDDGLGARVRAYVPRPLWSAYDAAANRYRWSFRHGRFRQIRRILDSTDPT